MKLTALLSTMFAAIAVACSSLICGGTASLDERDLAPLPTAAPHTPVAGDARLLSIDVLPAQDGDYDAAALIARSAGAQATSLSIYWDDFERAPGEFAPPEAFSLAEANLYYPYRDFQVIFNISVIDTNQRRVPADLMDRPFDDPEMIARFSAFLEYAFAQMPDVAFVSLSIGNEIDGYLDSRADWDAYQAFYEATAEHARTLRPGLPIGTKAMFSGLTGPESDHLQAMNQTSDVILVTYYPLKGDFTVQDPTVVGPAFDAIAGAYPDRPIYFLEIGYPSGELCNSSEEKQARFVQEVFRAWDTHADQVQLVSFTWLTDISETDVERFLGYYDTGDSRFAEYLHTLGLRTHAGQGDDKEAFRVLREEAAARGW